jgi:hypothetical protein
MTAFGRLSLLAIVLALTHAAAAWFAFDYGQNRERVGTQVAALKQIERAQEQSTTWRSAYDNAIDAMQADNAAGATHVAGIERELSRLRQQKPGTGTVPRDSAEALGGTYEDAEHDIERCGEHIARFGREAASAARSHQTLDRAYPTRAEGRADARVRREVTRTQPTKEEAP